MKKSTERKMTWAIMILLAVQIIPVTVILIANAIHKHRYHRDLLASDEIELRFSGPESVELSETHAYVRKDELEVSGCLNSKSRKVNADTQTVNLKVVAPSGNTLNEITVDNLYRCKLGGAHFRTRLPSIPTQGFYPGHQCCGEP